MNNENSKGSRKHYADSFSREWSIHDYKKMRTWGKTASERKAFFLKQMIVKPEELRGKTLLDAGCGNGEYSMALTEYGLNVVAADASSSVNMASQVAKERGVKNISFVQKDVAELPDSWKNKFDYVISSGVLHHTPDTRKSFLSLSKVVRPRGKMFVWLYLKYELTGYNVWKCRLYDAVSSVISRTPGIVQDIFCYGCLGLYIIRRRTLKNLRENLVRMHDNFTPRYNHRHTPEEIIGWFNEAGFENIKITDTSERAGVGIVGVKKNI